MDEIIIRTAEFEDLPQIVELMAEDTIGSTREEYAIPLPKCYIDAFNEINSSADNVLLVACDSDGIIGSLQITFTRYLSHKGHTRATIENVHVFESKRNAGVGTRLMNYAIDLAKDHCCSVVQLTSNKTRTDAHRFYKRLGFQNTHEGMKLNVK